MLELGLVVLLPSASVRSVIISSLVDSYSTMISSPFEFVEKYFVTDESFVLINSLNLSYDL